MSRSSSTLILIFLVIAGYSSNLRGASVDESALSSPDQVIEYSADLADRDEFRAAFDALEAGLERFPGNRDVLRVYADLLYERERYGSARRIYLQLSADRSDTRARSQIDAINARFERLTSSVNLATVAIQKARDGGNYETAIALGELAIGKFPDRAVLLTGIGEAQYLMGDLDGAEVTFRQALQLDPFDRRARELVEEIRSTEEAQVSTEFAEWMSIAKDKVGDFIVTFLALFAAFIANSLVAPISLRFKLNRARRHFHRGQYDEFTDLIEGLLDKEDFSPLRENFRFLLQEKSLEEAREILDRFVNTPDRLPALVRILEREHEKLVQSA